MKLSIIMPAYNEEKTIQKMVERVEKLDLGIDKEIVIVNDSSKDNTQKIINDLKRKYQNITSITHKTNKGKGAAIRTGLKNFTGDIMVIQDADLEYNPEDFQRMLQLILKGKTKVVYGSRMLGNITGFKIASHFYGNKFLSLITRILYGQKITDMETCYKMITKDLAKSLNLRANRFDIEPEITAKIIKKGHKIIEIPINYNARSFLEGKKIKWKDGITAILTLFKYRIFD